jgi:hypothetical protein
MIKKFPVRKLLSWKLTLRFFLLGFLLFPGLVSAQGLTRESLLQTFKNYVTEQISNPIVKPPTPVILKATDILSAYRNYTTQLPVSVPVVPPTVNVPVTIQSAPTIDISSALRTLLKQKEFINELRGPQGPQGEAGVPGLTGPSGPQGPAGSAGSSSISRPSLSNNGATAFNATNLSSSHSSTGTATITELTVKEGATVGGTLAVTGTSTLAALTATTINGSTINTNSGTLYGTLADSITSANLLSSISNETGTGLAVFNTAPIFATSITVGTTGTTTGSILMKGATSGTVTLATNAVAGTYTLTLPATDGTASQFLQTDGDGILSWTTIGGGGDALVGDPLSQFAATTSLQLKDTISDETGSGALVFGTSPVFTTPNIGSATGSVSGNAGTVTNATLTTALTVNTGTVTLTGDVANSSVLTLGAGASSISGANTGDNAVNSLYSGLAASKADVGQTMYIGTTQVAINRASAALTLAGITLTTPDIGVATATTVNKLTITAPATGSTLTVADGKVLTASNTLTFTGTDSSSVAFGTGGTVLYSGGALGTPSSGTGTNITGIPSANILAGTFGTGAYVMDTSLTNPILYGSAADNGDITIHGTSSATRTTSYVILQPTAGNVGIGTATPAQKLNVYGATGTYAGLQIDSNTLGYSTGMLFKTTADTSANYWKGGLFYVSTADGNGRGDIYLGANIANTSASVTPATLTGIVINGTTGNVGIGTTSPTTFKLQVAGNIGPNTDDGGTLGDVTHNFSDLFLASGGLINWNNGDIILTHSANLLTFGGATNGYTFNGTHTNSLNIGGATYPLYTNPTFTATSAVNFMIAPVFSPPSPSNDYAIQIIPATALDNSGSSRALYIRPNGITAGKTLGEATGIYFGDSVGDGTITTQYAIFSDNLAKGGSNYFLYSNGGTNYLAGNLGIGATSPSALGLEISKASANAGILLRRTTDVTANSSMYIDANGDLTIINNHATRGILIASQGVARLNIDANGEVSAWVKDEVSNVALCYSGAELAAGAVRIIGDCTGTGADYAERYPVANDVEYGDIVMLGDELINTYGAKENGSTDWDTVIGRTAKLVKATNKEKMIGILSDNYSDFTSTGKNIKDEDNPKPVALVGRVPVKINLEGGDIEIGDKITLSSIPGVGTKATTISQVVGVALEPFNSSSIGNTIEVFIKNEKYIPDAILANYVDLNSNMEAIAGLAVPVPGSTNETFATAFFNNVYAKVGVWLADAGNGIGDFFANRVRTKQICISNDGGETCINRDQLDSLLSNAGSSSSGSSTPPPEEETPPVEEDAPVEEEIPPTEEEILPEVPTCVDPQILVDNVCVDPAPAPELPAEETPPVEEPAP